MWIVRLIYGALVLSVCLSFKRNDSRVYDGHPSKTGQWPWQVYLSIIFKATIASCGGSLIHYSWVLTAAHCAQGAIYIGVYLGVTKLTSPKLIVDHTEYFIHPEYGFVGQSIPINDMALIWLSQYVNDPLLIRPIRLQASWQAHTDYSKTTAFSSGFGITNVGKHDLVGSELLLWAQLNLISNEECGVWCNIEMESAPDTIVCASGGSTVSQSVCSGDSGGPLFIVDEDGEHTLIGVTSFGAPSLCPHARVNERKIKFLVNGKFPIGFTRPGHYHDWIKKVTNLDLDWKAVRQRGTTVDMGVESVEDSLSVDYVI